MMKNVDSRFYWAPVLDQILQTVPRNVQLTHVGADAATDGRASNTLTISGISSAAEPRKEAEALRTALDARLGSQFKSVSSVFKTLDDSDQVVLLDGRRLSTATFTIEFQLELKDPVDAAPVVTFRKSKFASAQ
jgi:Tfp pilus assembly protein PilN